MARRAPPSELEVIDQTAALGWRRWLKLWPLAIIAAVVVAVFASGLNRYLSLDELSAQRVRLQELVRDHPAAMVAGYIGLYFTVVAFSIPGAAMLMTMTGGFLFGTLGGTAAAVTGASAGATAMFLVARSALGGVLRARAPEGAGGMIQKIEQGVRSNAFSYLLVLRLIPAAPFWVVNIAAGFVAIPLRTYVVATVVGIIPPTLIYASFGSGLGRVFERGDTPDLSLMLQPQFYLPLSGLAALSLLPVALHAWRVHRRRITTAE